MRLLCSDVKKMYKKVCCICRPLVLPRSSINAHKIMLFWCLCCCCSCSCYGSLFWSEGAQCHDKWKNPKCTKLCIYSETTGYYKNVPLLLRGAFYRHSVSAMKLSSLNELRHEKSWIFCYLKTQWGLFYYFQLESLLHPEHIAESILFFSFFAI